MTLCRVGKFGLCCDVCSVAGGIVVVVTVVLPLQCVVLEKYEFFPCW